MREIALRVPRDYNEPMSNQLRACVAIRKKERSNRSEVHGEGLNRSEELGEGSNRSEVLEEISSVYERAANCKGKTACVAVERKEKQPFRHPGLESNGERLN
ncbi:hypothetical protein TNCT_606991 [Trichonephila clavata]|uniref:Uncharacterized protein n=1 Tax=Trichonephila clavata TaxID=2740835 RepID=A0A8X6KJ64_TRICU|nr:hypothetical protein TNCT_606991 [Trichonephila clavata]